MSTLKQLRDSDINEIIGSFSELDRIENNESIWVHWDNYSKGCYLRNTEKFIIEALVNEIVKLRR